MLFFVQSILEKDKFGLIFVKDLDKFGQYWSILENMFRDGGPLPGPLGSRKKKDTFLGRGTASGL